MPKTRFKRNPFRAASWNDRWFKVGGTTFLLDPMDRMRGTPHTRERVILCKYKPLLDSYAHFWEARRPRADNILELGILRGGGLLFWDRLLTPKKLVAVDIETEAGRAPGLRRYLSSLGAAKRLKTYWETSQADRRKLHRIVTEEFSKPIDLVIDDASHFYSETRKGFEALFPLLRPGGFFVIEDWAWAHEKIHQKSEYFRGQPPLTRLISECVAAAGSHLALIPSITIYPRVIFIERGTLPDGPFQLDDLIV